MVVSSLQDLNELIAKADKVSSHFVGGVQAPNSNVQGVFSGQPFASTSAHPSPSNE